MVSNWTNWIFRMESKTSLLTIEEVHRIFYMQWKLDFHHSSLPLFTLISKRRSIGCRHIGHLFVWNLKTFAHSPHMHCIDHTILLIEKLLTVASLIRWNQGEGGYHMSTWKDSGVSRFWKAYHAFFSRIILIEFMLEWISNPEYLLQFKPHAIHP